jgi:hypothetical protein
MDHPTEASTHPHSRGTGMSRLRLLLVHAAIAVVVLGHLRSLITNTEDWPFSRYPMYSYPPPKELIAYRLAGVVGGGPAEPERELPLTNYQYFRPISYLAAGATLGRLNGRPERAKELDAAMGELAARYEALRRDGRHNGPPLRRLRLYRLSWSVQPGASNSDRPDRRELVHEVVREL